MRTERDNTPETELSFEAALEQLDETVRKLESGEPTLDESIRLYEEGVRLYRLCEEKLAAARGKLERVLEDKTGALAIEPMDEDPEEDI